MRHARRNEIYRDVGSSAREPDDPAFIEIDSFPMPSDGLLLLCSDGLTDLIGSAEILAGVERYSPDFDAAIHALIDAANHAGGKDNITIAIVAGPEYGGASVPLAGKPVKKRTHPNGVALKWVFLVCGLLLGAGSGWVARIAWNGFATAGPRTITVGPAGIAAALSQAHSGDTVDIPQGRYRERIELREGVILRTQLQGTVILISPDKGPALIARKLDSGGVAGISIVGDPEAPLAVGIEVVDASPFITNVRITGANVGIEVQGNSRPYITASQITSNLGAGILVSPGASPRIESNLIAANGNGQTGEAKPGVEVLERAHPVLKDNAIVNNGAEPIWVHGRFYQPADLEENYFGGLTARQAIRLTEVDPERPHR
jgi:hypothetical protein